jgi:K+-transporting ATPase ATPase C chain
LFISIKFVILNIFIIGLGYPLILFVFGQAIFPFQANGSLIRNKEGNIIGSELIGQKMRDEKYFWPRPSAADYNSLKSSASNLPLSSQVLQKDISNRYVNYHTEAGQVIPIDIITSSASGLDPHISPKAAYMQIERIAKTRKINPYRLKYLIDELIERPQYFIFGNYRVNVLKLNLELDERFKTENVR